MTKKIIFNLFLKGMLVSLFFVLPLGLEAKNIDIGTSVDQIRIPGTLCLGENCKTSWDQAGLWQKNANHAYYSVLGGNVGIGTDNPQLALDIAKTEGFRTNGPVIFSGSLYTGSGNRLLTVDNTGNVFATSISSAVGLPSSATAGQTLRSNGTSWLANSNLYNDGTNVGIGTINPTASLQIGDASSVSNYLKVIGSSADNTYDVFRGERKYPRFTLKDTVAGGAEFNFWNLGGTMRFGTQTGTAEASAWYTKAGYAADVIFNGNLGIGTTSPIRKLGVKGEAEFTGLVHGLSPGESQDLALTTVVYVRDYVSGISTSTVGFWTKSGNNIYNANSGNVGIGISNPSTARLQISNLANTEGLRIIASNHSPLVIRNTADNSDLMRLNQEGKLELNSSLKVGNTDDVCDASNTGAIKHNPVSGQSYICNGKMWLNQNNCGMVADEDGNTYGTVQIGGQCWMTENMRVGTMLASASTNPKTGDQVIEKWCYDDNPANCEIYGGLYDWNEAMRGSEVSGAQGICPSGWHIPTDAELNELEKTAVAIINSSNSQYPCDLNSSGWQRCADNTGNDYGANGAGSALRQVGLGTGVGNGTDLVGFSGNLPGYRNTNGSYDLLGSNLYLWSSTPVGSSNAWQRDFNRDYSTVSRYADVRGYGFSVTCLRD